MKTYQTALLFLFLLTSCGKKEEKKLDPQDAIREGLNGKDGEVGPAGPSGPIGETGPIGPTGQTGERGYDANYVPTHLSAKSSTSGSLADNSKYCRDLVEGGFSDWHIPTLEEIVPWLGTDNDTDFLTTRTPYFVGAGQYYVTVRMSNGVMSSTQGIVANFVRCVR